MNRIEGILDDRNTAARLDRPQPGRAVVQVSAQDHSNNTRPIRPGRGTKQGINGGPVAILRRTPYDSHFVVLHQHVTVGRRDVDPALRDWRLVSRGKGRQGTVPVENFRNEGPTLRPGVLDDENGRGKIRRQQAYQPLQRLQPPGRGSDDDDIPSARHRDRSDGWRASEITFSKVSTATGLARW